MSTIDELQQMTREPNWDLDGGRVVSAALWQQARSIYAELAPIAEPHVSACGDGTVHFGWIRANGARLNLEIEEGMWYIAMRLQPTVPYSSLSTNRQTSAVEEIKWFLSETRPA